MLNTLSLSGINGRAIGTSPGVTRVPGTVPGDPIRLLFEPLKNSRAPASLYLLRCTSTKRISACTWLGSCWSCADSIVSSAMSALARPLTNSMARCGAGAQAVHSIRLVLPGPTAVSNTARSPLAWTSATLGSPTATRLMATGRRSSCCRPWSISITEGNWLNAAQPLSAAWAIGSTVSIVRAGHNCLSIRSILRMAASLLGHGVLEVSAAWAPRMICMPEAPLPGATALAIGTWES